MGAKEERMRDRGTNSEGLGRTTRDGRRNMICNNPSTFTIARVDLSQISRLKNLFLVKTPAGTTNIATYLRVDGQSYQGRSMNSLAKDLELRELLRGESLPNHTSITARKVQHDRVKSLNRR